MFHAPGLVTYHWEYGMQAEAEELVLKGNVDPEAQAGLGQCPGDEIQVGEGRYSPHFCM